MMRIVSRILVNRGLWVLALLVPVSLLSGCGGGGGATPNGSLSGHVWVEDLSGEISSLAVGTVVVSGPKQVQATVENGRFSVYGLPAGTYRVVLGDWSPPGGDGISWLVIPEEYPAVAVQQDVETVNVDFTVRAIPAPPQF